MPRLAIRGGKPIRAKPFPPWPISGPEEERNVLEVLRSGKWFHGERVRAFEGAFAAFQDAPYGIACANGTVAIEAALIAAGVWAGDEVITTPFSFVATTSAILRANAIPVFADIDEMTGNLDPDDVEKRITPRTKAILPVHVNGLPVDIDRFTEIGQRYNIPIIYDAAHAWGSQWRDKGVGAYGAYNTYSFQASKHITAGEGGMILTTDESLARIARSYVNCGRLEGGGWYEHFSLGTNLRLTEFQAAILLAQIERLEEHTLTRMRNAAWLDKQFAGFEGIRVAAADPRVPRRSYHAYLVLYDKEAWKGLPRERLVAALQAEGIRIADVWPLLYRMPLFSAYSATGARACPVSCPYHKAPPPDYAALRLPRAERLAYETGIELHHTFLLGDGSDARDFFNAMVKVRENLDELL